MSQLEISTVVKQKKQKKRVLWEKIYTQSSAVRNMQKEKIIIKALVLVSFLTYPS